MAIRITSDPEQDYYSQLASDNAARMTADFADQYANRPEVAQIVAANKFRHPTLTPGAALALGQAGLGPDSPQAQQLAQLTAQRKAKKGWNMGDFAGDVVGGIGKIAKYINPFSEKALGPLARPAVRAITTVGDAGIQAFDAGFRQLGHDIGERGLVGALTRPLTENPFDPNSGLFSWAEQQTVTQAGFGVARGEGLQLGSGFFPGGEAYAEADRISRNVYDIDGQAGTLERIIAREIFEPGTKPYNALSGVLGFAKAWVIDPTVVAGKASAMSRASKQLISNTDLGRQAGLLRSSSRWTVDDAASRAFATMDERGRAFITAAAQENDTYATMRKFGLPASTARKFADTRSEPEALAVYLDEFQAGILRDRPVAPINFNASILDSERSIRLLASFPREGQVFRANTDQAINHLVSYARNAGMGEKLIAPYVDLLARADNNATFDEIFKDLFESDIANRIAGAVNDDGIIEGTGKVLKLGDKVYSLNTPGRGEIVNVGTRKGIHKEYDRAVSKMPREIEYEESFATVRFHHGGLDTYEDIPFSELSVHLPFTRIRSILKLDTSDVLNDVTGELAANAPRLGVPIGGDIVDLGHAGPIAEHLTGVLELPDIRELRRLSTTYGRALENAALKWIPSSADFAQHVWRATHLLTMASVARNIGEAWARMGADGLISISHHPIQSLMTVIGKRGDANDLLSASDELAQLVQHSSSAWLDRSVQHHSKIVRAADPSFTSNWADRIANYNHDPTMRRLAGGWDGSEAVTRSGNNLIDTKEWFYNEYLPTLKAKLDERRWPGYFKSRAASDKYIDSLASQLNHIARDDSTILEAIARGVMAKSDGTTIPLFSRDKGLSIDPALSSYLSTRVAQPNTPPWLKAAREWDEKAKKKADSIVTTLFRVLWDKPTDKLVIIPTFRRYYAQRLPELMPLMTKEGQDDLIRWAKEAGYSRSELRGLAAGALKGTGNLSHLEADAVAKTFALDRSRDLLYDFHNKSQFGDIGRHFFPFFDAWKDMLVTWVKLSARNPAIPRKLQIAVQHARGNDADPNTGWFHVDPQTGEEVFSFPGGRFITENIPGGPGIPIDLTGRVQGLNLFSSTPLMPGVGPIVQIPLSHVIPDRPDTLWAKDMVIPFGMPTLEATPGGGFRSQIAGAFLPPWFQKIATGITADATNDRNYMNSVKDAASYLMSTGEYDPRNPIEMQAMEDKAMKLAKSVWWLRGLAQWLAPTAPTPEWQAYDIDGRLRSQWSLSKEFNDMFRDPEIGSDNAVNLFLTKYGTNNLLLMQPNTEGYSPDSEAAYNFELNHPDLVRNYPDAIRYFEDTNDKRAPYEAYQKALNDGLRKPLSYQEWIARANDRVGSMLYYHMRDQLGPKLTKKEIDFLSGYRIMIAQDFPGFDPQAQDPQRRKRTIAQLYTAAARGDLNITRAGRGIAAYLQARDQAIEAAARGGIKGWDTAKKTRNIRNWLRTVAQQVSEQYPEFREAWEALFQGEMVRDG